MGSRLRFKLRFAFVESLKRYIVNRDGHSISRWDCFIATQRIAMARRVGECQNLWETAKAEITLRNAGHAVKRRSASRSRSANRNRQNNAPNVPSADKSKSHVRPNVLRRFVSLHRVKNQRSISSGKVGRNCEKDYRNHHRGRGCPDRHYVHGYGQGRISQPRRQSECPRYKQKANRRSFGDDKCDNLAATSPEKSRFLVLV